MFRLGLVGAGRMGQTHLRALKHSKVVQVVAVVEPRAEVAQQLESEGYRVFASSENLVTANLVDGFLIAVPSGLHLSTIRELLPAGLPILCEKPCGLSVADAMKIKEVTQAANVRLQIGYWRRFLPQLRELKNKIQSGAIGRILLIQANQWDFEPPAAAFRNTSGGIFKDMGVHEVDQIRWMTGNEIASLNAREILSSEPGVKEQDSGVVDMTLLDGTLAIATLGRFYESADFVGVEVWGTAGHERLDLLNAQLGDAPQLDALLAQTEAFAAGAHPDAATIDDAIAALKSIELIEYQITEKSRA